METWTINQLIMPTADPRVLRLHYDIPLACPACLVIWFKCLHTIHYHHVIFFFTAFAIYIRAISSHIMVTFIACTYTIRKFNIVI